MRPTLRLEYKQKSCVLSVGYLLRVTLGGDNIDSALAHVAENRITKADKKLSAADLSQLLQPCKIAKERMLAVKKRCQSLHFARNERMALLTVL